MTCVVFVKTLQSPQWSIKSRNDSAADAGSEAVRRLLSRFPVQPAAPSVSRVLRPPGSDFLGRGGSVWGPMRRSVWQLRSDPSGLPTRWLSVLSQEVAEFMAG